MTMRSMFGDENYTDRLQHAPLQLEIATDEARNHWYPLDDEAMTHLDDGKIHPTISSRDILFRAPALPASQLALY
ncbi:uncharacterized protein N7503_000308 [Penicillium pulvis]|uniref:uncharacterized protein n=1 Tax=Penicillium pulvis TaxID=1562058 RepID=UPI0025467CE9|nr:uncharacterized protein N7503_000308 [Penicillium pulvis]KAJ5813558.1 hypothetical protein N7503_000308 [Penicillium pulvis]